jgi:hypothetical protein
VTLIFLERQNFFGAKFGTIPVLAGVPVETNHEADNLDIGRLSWMTTLRQSNIAVEWLDKHP